MPAGVGTSARLTPPSAGDGPKQLEYARALAQRGQLFAALIPAERAVKLEPQSAPAYLLAALISSNLGYNADALRFYRRSIQLDPSLLEAYQRMGDLQLGNGDTSGAEATFKMAMTRTPDTAGPRLSLARLYSETQQHSKLMDTLSPLLQSPAAPVAALYLAGKSCQTLGRTREAEDYLNRAIKARPDFADAYHALGSIHANEGRYSDGIPELEKAVAVQPDNPVFHYALGNALRSDTARPDHLSLARDAFEKALELDPTMTIAHYFYGLTLEETSEPEAALRELRHTLQLDPKFLSAGYRIGVIYRSIGNEKEGKRYLEQFGKAAKSEITQVHTNRRQDSFVDTAQAQYHRAMAYLKSGDRARAIAALKEALARDPSYGLARRQLGELGAGIP